MSTSVGTKDWPGDWEGDFDYLDGDLQQHDYRDYDHATLHTRLSSWFGGHRLDWLSPEDTVMHIGALVSDYRKMGVRTVWVIDPKQMLV
jgi:hypothetical protein